MSHPLDYQQLRRLYIIIIIVVIDGSNNNNNNNNKSSRCCLCQVSERAVPARNQITCALVLISFSPTNAGLTPLLSNFHFTLSPLNYFILFSCCCCYEFQSKVFEYYKSTMWTCTRTHSLAQWLHSSLHSLTISRWRAAQRQQHSNKIVTVWNFKQIFIIICSHYHQLREKLNQQQQQQPVQKRETNSTAVAAAAASNDDASEPPKKQNRSKGNRRLTARKLERDVCVCLFECVLVLEKIKERERREQKETRKHN